MRIMPLGGSHLLAAWYESEEELVRLADAAQVAAVHVEVEMRHGTLRPMCSAGSGPLWHSVIVVFSCCARMAIPLHQRQFCFLVHVSCVTVYLENSSSRAKTEHIACKLQSWREVRLRVSWMVTHRMIVAATDSLVGEAVLPLYFLISEPHGLLLGLQNKHTDTSETHVASHGSSWMTAK